MKAIKKQDVKGGPLNESKRGASHFLADVAQTSKSAVSRVSKPAYRPPIQRAPPPSRPADLEIGDTAGLETCATKKLQESETRPPKSGFTRKPVETLIASDSAQTLKTLEHVLDEGRIFKVIAVATDGCEALRLAFTRQPELILISDWMSHMDGIEATHYIKQLRAPPVVVIVASDDNPIAKARAAAASADGFVPANGQLDSDLRKLLRERFRFNGKERKEG